MDKLLAISTFAVVLVVFYSPSDCHPTPKTDCHWMNTTGYDIISDSTQITVLVEDASQCLVNCMNKTDLTSCHTVRYHSQEQTCRYSDLQYEDDSIDLTPNEYVVLYQLQCPKHGILALNPAYVALAGMGGMVVLLLITIIIIICVLSGRRI